MLSLAIITLASCGSGLPDPDGLRIPNWGKSTKSAVHASAFRATAMDNDGNIVAVGYQKFPNPGSFDYGDGVTLEGTNQNAYIVTGGGGENVLIVKYNALTGKTLWARSTKTASHSSQFKAVATDRFGNIYAMGQQIKDGVFAYGNGVTAQGANSVSNAVIVKYNSEGQAIWARSVNPAPKNSYFGGVATDKEGNIYAVGRIYQTGVFGYGNGVTVSGAYDGMNAVLVKYNSNGQAIWARSVNPAPQSSYFGGVAADKEGNIYAVGRIYRTGVFGYGNGVTVSGAYDGMNAVLVKYNSNGQAIWARSTTFAQERSMFNAVATDRYGNIYTVGQQIKDGVFGYGNGVTARGGAASSWNSMIVKYGSDGQALWAKSVNLATEKSEFKGVATDKEGNIYAVGSQNKDGVFGYGNGVMVSGGFPTASNAVIVKYNKHGQALWARSTVRASSGSIFNSVVVDRYGNVYVAGLQNTGIVAYGGISKEVTGIFNSPNALLVKYNSDGQTQWATVPTVPSGTNYSLFYSLAVSLAGDVYVAGYQSNTQLFNYGNGVTAKAVFVGNNAVLVKYQSHGKAIWAKTTIKASQNSSHKGITTSNNKLFVVGEQSGNNSYNYGNGAGDIKGNYSSSYNAVINTFEH